MLNKLLQEGFSEMKVYEPSLCNNFAKERGLGVHGDIIARGSLFGGVLLEGRTWLHTTTAWNDCEVTSNWRNAPLSQAWASFLGARHVTQDTNWRCRINMTRLIQERLSFIKLPRGQLLDRSAPATTRTISTFRAVVGVSLLDCSTMRTRWSWERLLIARSRFPSHSERPV